MRWSRIILPFAAVLIISWLLGLYFDHQYKKRWDVLFFNKTEELIRSDEKFDLVLLGNSRVHFGINPWYLDSVSRLSSFNFANGGSDVEDLLLTSELYLAHHPLPKAVIISLDPGMMKKNESLKTLYHYLFYLDDSTMRKYMLAAGHPVKLLRLLPFIKYSVMDEYNRTSVFNNPPPLKIFDHNIYRGYLNIHETTGTSAKGTYDIRRYKQDSLWKPSINLLSQLISLWANKNVEIIFVYPPEKSESPFRKWKLYADANQVFDSLAKTKNISCLHFENDPAFADKWFVDDIHLNHPGATLYSTILGDALRKHFAK